MQKQINYTVFTTMNNGELRAYSVGREVNKNMTAVERMKFYENLIEEAKSMDELSYPDNVSPFINVSIVPTGTCYDIVWGEVV
jgi:hypothetical protein